MREVLLPPDRLGPVDPEPFEIVRNRIAGVTTNTWSFNPDSNINDFLFLKDYFDCNLAPRLVGIPDGSSAYTSRVLALRSQADHDEHFGEMTISKWHFDGLRGGLFCEVIISDEQPTLFVSGALETECQDDAGTHHTKGIVLGALNAYSDDELLKHQPYMSIEQALPFEAMQVTDMTAHKSAVNLRPTPSDRLVLIPGFKIIPLDT